MKDFFDRKTFDPVNKAADKSTLGILRQIGKSRHESFLVGGRGRAVQSAALRTALNKWGDKKAGTFLDLGCGDSADALVANSRGFTAFGIDLFPPSITTSTPKYFLQSDVVEHIPCDDGWADVIVSQAMLDLIEPVARGQFFREVNRALSPGGVFVCHIQWLQSGWGFDLNEERERAASVWPNVRKAPNGFCVITGDSNE